MKQLLLALLLLLLSASIYSSDSTSIKTLVTQTITYHTSKASDVYIFWSLNNWATPASREYWPRNSALKEDKMVQTKMNRNKDNFSVDISLPAKSNISYMFWVPVDVNGDSTDGWDTYGKMFFSSNFSGNKKININDDALWMPAKKSTFNILKAGSSVLLATIIICIALIFVFRKHISYSAVNLYTGTLIFSVIIMAIVRTQMNGLFKENSFYFFGSVLDDLLWLFFISVIFYLLVSLFKKSPKMKIGTTVFFVLLLISSLLFSLLNIEIVQRLGRPLNYQWLYYSDFMKGPDAKNAIAYNMSSNLEFNILLLLLSSLIFGSCYSLLPVYKKWLKMPLLICGIFLLGIGYAENKKFGYDTHKTANPIVELLSSAINTEKKPQIFSMSVSPETQRYIQNYHSINYGSRLDSNGVINNIILFVLESTGKRYINIYDSTYNVTPNLKKWKNIATVFNNNYAHIPSTSNSMLSMVSGIYPNIGFRSVVGKVQREDLPSIPGELKKQGWNTSMFSSADLSFGNMEGYARKNDFMFVGDSKTISCSYKKFEVTNTSLDGLDDRCIINHYVEWGDSLKNKKKFSMFWTNQTHYPYAFNTDTKVQYVNNNEEFNRYLNALHNADEAFGMLMNGLQKRNILKSTLVIVVGDHGEAFGTHDQTGHGSKIYEENISIPCLIYNPMLCSGKTENKITSLIDIAPTIAHIVGIQKPKAWEGKSLFANTNDDRAFFICPYSDFLFGTRTGNWKYIYNATTNEDELYDLEKDPKELKNIAAQHRDIVKREYEMLGAWIQYHNRLMSSLNIKN
jgi:arylsulfatase A-like enzyme